MTICSKLSSSRARSLINPGSVVLPLFFIDEAVPAMFDNDDEVVVFLRMEGFWAERGGVCSTAWDVWGDDFLGQW